MTKTSFLIFAVFISLSLPACGDYENGSAGSDSPPSASSAKKGSVTLRVVNKKFLDGGNKTWCDISVAEINNSDRDLRTFQISKFESKTSLGTTSKHSTNYKGLKNGESRISNLHVLAPSCDDVIAVNIKTLLCNFDDDLNAVCDNTTEYVFEDGLGTKLTSSFEPYVLED